MSLFNPKAIDAFYPSCSVIIRDAISCCPSSYDETTYDYEGDKFMRMLGAGGGGDICKYPYEETDYSAGCDYNKYHGVHVAHAALFWTTIAILGLFEIELLMLMYLLGPKSFSKELMYVIDFVVVTSSLVLELMFKYAGKEVLSSLPGILVVFRVWRFVRIGHGLVASTYEVQERKIHLAMHYIEELEEKVRQHEQDSPVRPKKLKHSKSQLSSKLMEIRMSAQKTQDDVPDPDELLREYD